MIKDFDYLFYINYYEDLKKNNINNFNKALKHYTTNGINENRYYSKEHSKIFNENSWILYRRNNLDLKKTKKRPCLLQYLKKNNLFHI